VLENYAPKQLNNNNKNNNNNNNNFILQLDGSCVHFSCIVHDYLNVNFPGRWIGTGGQIALPHVLQI
jgi:hypothetical protein